ncbi:hypothetical protein PF008_g21235 [Phytophthora fragariae]|uniref:Uncharacterized protein n=1 Tax=Phytophthora fragariae TaxID=53985 RepID=A0A6G0QX69_9STRA|nr:hypothetical protein PF008_g21235 [Phytophthora fragariae]
MTPTEILNASDKRHAQQISEPGSRSDRHPGYRVEFSQPYHTQQQFGRHPFDGVAAGPEGHHNPNAQQSGRRRPDRAAGTEGRHLPEAHQEFDRRPLDDAAASPEGCYHPEAQQDFDRRPLDRTAAGPEGCYNPEAQQEFDQLPLDHIVADPEARLSSILVPLSTLSCVGRPSSSDSASVYIALV